MDHLTVEKRSCNMSRITSKNTKPGFIIRIISVSDHPSQTCSFRSSGFNRSRSASELLLYSYGLIAKAVHERQRPSFLASRRFAPEYPDTFLRYIQDKFMMIHGKIYNISGNLHIAAQKGPAGKAGYCSAKMEDGNFCARVLPAPA
jgi:hypothetical protein